MFAFISCQNHKCILICVVSVEHIDVSRGFWPLFPQISSMSWRFVFWEAVPHTKYCCLFKVKILCSFQNFGLVTGWAQTLPFIKLTSSCTAAYFTQPVKTSVSDFCVTYRKVISWQIRNKQNSNQLPPCVSKLWGLSVQRRLLVVYPAFAPIRYRAFQRLVVMHCIFH